MRAENAERFGDFHACGINASVLIRGVGQGQRMLDQSGMKASAIMAPAEAVARAVVEAVTKDGGELVIQPAPGRLPRSIMDYFPGPGPHDEPGRPGYHHHAEEHRTARAGIRRR